MKLSVFFVVLPTPGLLDFAGFAETLHVANQYGGEFSLHYIGPESSTTSSVGIRLSGIMPLPDALPDNAIVVIGDVADWDGNLSTSFALETAEWLARTLRQEHKICTICSGAFLAAKAGLLDGRECTCHYEVAGILAKQYPSLKVLENRVFVIDGPVMSCAGVTSGIDLALHLVSETAGPVCAADTAQALVIYTRRAGNDPQRSPWLAGRNHLHPLVHRAQDIVIKDFARAWTVKTLADYVHTSARNLSRLFREHTDSSVLGYLHRIRIAKAKQLLEHTTLNLEHVAEAVGFGSSHQLRRVWRKFEPNTPGALTKARVSAAVS